MTVMTVFMTMDGDDNVDDIGMAYLIGKACELSTDGDDAENDSNWDDDGGVDCW